MRSGGVTLPASTPHPGSQDEAGRNLMEESKINHLMGGELRQIITTTGIRTSHHDK